MPLRRRHLLGQGHVRHPRVLLGTVERRPGVTPSRSAARASAPGPPTARCTVGVTGANDVAGPELELERLGLGGRPAHEVEGLARAPGRAG